MLALDSPLAPCAAAHSVRKRAFDLGLAGLALVLTSPLLVLVALGLMIEGRGPIVVSERRTGLAGRDIRLYRFRTRGPSPGPGRPPPPAGAPHGGGFGRFLHRSGLAQLPELFNVVRGEMSLVGPHPHAPDYEQYFVATVEGYAGRFRALPGMTGLAQVMAQRGVIPMSGAVRQRVAYDLRYIDDWSPLLDLRILAEALLGAFVAPAGAH